MTRSQRAFTFTSSSVFILGLSAHFMGWWALLVCLFIGLIAAVIEGDAK